MRYAAATLLTNSKAHTAYSTHFVVPSQSTVSLKLRIFSHHGDSSPPSENHSISSPSSSPRNCLAKSDTDLRRIFTGCHPPISRSKPAIQKSSSLPAVICEPDSSAPISRRLLGQYHQRLSELQLDRSHGRSQLAADWTAISYTRRVEISHLIRTQQRPRAR